MIKLNDLILFYKDCDYWPADQKRRPRELHLPKLLSDIFSKSSEKDIETDITLVSNNKLEVDIGEEDLMFLRSVMLHESLFHFYKGFYNYLAARNLYFGGMIEWIKITLYYSKFYFARSLTSLMGIQSYRVSKKNDNSGGEFNTSIFSDRIANLLRSDSGKIPNKYRIRLETDIINKKAKIIFDKNLVSSHSDVWTDYQKLDIKNLCLYDLLMRVDKNFKIRKDDFSVNYIISQRNEENYSFDGYAQLDFNLSTKSFKQYFERKHIKKKANVIYDFESGSILLAFTSHLQLFRALKIIKLPLEKDKISYMINYCLPNSRAKKNLLLLCNEDFKIQNLYSADGEIFYDDQGRTL